MTVRSLMLLPILLLMSSCTNPQDKARIAQLEKQTKALQEQAERQDRTANLDLQAKCSNDARVWFIRNWSRDKDTILLDQTSHYNASLNKCFILVQYNYDIDAKSDLVSRTLTVKDVYENLERGSGSEVQHLVDDHPVSTTCSVDGSKKGINTFQECFNLLTVSFMEK